MTPAELEAIRARDALTGLAGAPVPPPEGVVWSDSCVMRAYDRRVLLAALDEREALVGLVAKVMEQDCAFDDDESPRRCWAHDAEWPSLDRPCEWVIAANAALAALGVSA